MIIHTTKVFYGNRLSAQGKLRLGCSAILYDETREAVLLTCRTDNGQWCLPGGMINPGESVAEGCEREVFEETGLYVQVIRLIGVYSDPNRLIVYPDGNKACVIVLAFEVKHLDGNLKLSEETSDARFIPVHEALKLDLFHDHGKQIQDSLAGNDAAYIR
jgi:ADP-ribose pyrophosphatase YjhB (NUDIX family)